MTLLEYLNKITNFGTKCALPSEVFHMRTEESSVGDGAGGKSGATIVKYTSESISEQKREYKLLQTVSSRVLNAREDNASIKRLWDALMIFVPKDFRNGDYNSSKTDFRNWVLMMADTICSELTDKMLVERHCPGARYWLTTLQTRMEAWTKSVKVDANDDNSDSKRVEVTFNF